MLNYIKSEFYRIFHSKEVYLLTGIFAALLAAYNIILYFVQRSLPGFLYGNTHHAYIMIDASMGMFFYVIIIICSSLDGSSLKNLKNSVGYGVDRKVIFLGRVITQAIICVVMYLGLMGFYYILGKALLEDSGREISEMFVRSTFVCIPMLLGALVLYHCCILWSNNTIISAVIMILILDIIPRGIDVIAYKFPQIRGFSNMLMRNLMQVQLVETATGYDRVYGWQTTEGVIRCIVAGVCAIVIFSVLGIKSMQKKEIR